MKKSILYILYILSLLSLSACENQDPSMSDQSMPIVVEGWIENGVSPVVMVTHAVNLTADSVSFDNFVEKWCRVSVYDGDTRYLLTGTVNKDYTPSFIFTSSSLKGKTGHAYRLLIEFEARTIQSTSTIMDAPVISRLEPIAVEDNDTLFSIRAFVSGIDPERHYKIFVKSGKEDSRYYGSFLGTFSGNEYDDFKGLTITKGIHAVHDEDAFSHYFSKGDVVRVKIASMQPEIYNFWKIYDNTVSLSNNLLFTFTSNLPTNLVLTDSDADTPAPLGYWAAYGISESVIRL